MKTTAHKGVRIDTEVVEKINQEAKKQHRSFSNMVNYILETYFDKGKAPVKSK